MRIIGGEYRGIRITLPRNFRARPTTDMAKEGLFNILHNRIDFSEIKALDLFSGTGGISFELASRGCEQIVLVEKNPVHYQHIHNTIDKLRLKGVITPIKTDVFRFLSMPKEKYDFIFADPPYDLDKVETLPGIILNAGILNPNGLFVFEHSSKYNFKKVEGYLETRKYSSVHFTFFKKA